ncbi:MAG: Gfo/Idh/MocA family oxidoreductase [Clostridia bacterium]|nr:Gfo/Idh/MocA family oxidoreductase [Clostridia bacterium]
MKKIAILGCENSHADSFLTNIKKKRKFRDVEVVGIYSDERDAVEKLHKTFGAPIMENYADAVGKIDGLVITARHGDNHYKYAKPYLDSGIPMFIDKPITTSEEEALEFMAKLREKGIRVSGGSSLKHDVYVQKLKEENKNNVGGKTLGGFIRAPYSDKNEYGNFFFYAQHLVEMICEIYGRFPISAFAKQTGENISITLHYENYDVQGLYCNNKYLYFASRMSESSSTSYNIPITEDWASKEFLEFYDILNGGNQTLSYEEFFSPVFIMNAIERSLKSGKEELINKM